MGREPRLSQREARVLEGRSKERENGALPKRRWEREVERMGEREEKTALKAVRVDGGREDRKTRMAAMMDVMYGLGLGF